MKKIKINVILPLLMVLTIYRSSAQEQENQKSLEVYGFAMMDMGYDLKQINPNWFDALRISKLPSYKDQYAPDGETFFGVRQTRFGVRGYSPLPKGELKVVFEFDMFGVGGDEGQTTIRLRHAYGELGRFLAGQTHSPFMDADLWPNTVEYWGPTGMVFFRNVQLRYAPITGDNELFIALERPGLSGDQGTLSDRIELDSIRTRLDLPDLSAHFKKSGKWGHIQLSGMLRSIKWDDIHTTGGYDIGGSTYGWGGHLSTVINLGKNTKFRGSFVHGEGIENYMNDAPVDVGVISTGNPSRPFDGKALPVTGTMAWIDHNLTDKWWASIGYSSTSIENTENASPTGYNAGQYAMLTVGSSPFKNAMAAIEFQWGTREGVNGYSAEEMKIQMSFKYSFSQIFYSNKKQ